MESDGIASKLQGQSENLQKTKKASLGKKA